MHAQHAAQLLAEVLAGQDVDVEVGGVVDVGYDGEDVHPGDGGHDERPGGLALQSVGGQQHDGQRVGRQ